MSAPRVAALVVDDSATSRALLVALLSADPEVEVVGEATTGEEAVAAVERLAPSVVVMDVHMPVLDGFEACSRIMASRPTPIVIVTSSMDARDVATGLRATEVGALAVLPKPPSPSSPAHEREARRLVDVIKALADVKVVRRRADRRRPDAPAVTTPARRQRLEAVAVAASTGGPAAVHRFLAALPPAAGSIPLLLVQHIAEGFTKGLVRWLGTATDLEVRVAEHGARLAPGVVHVAPDGAHLLVDQQRRVHLDHGPPVKGFRPSATRLLRSVAAVYREAGAGVILTGMGSDGLDGARDLRAAGGLVLAQDEQTSTVFGMPRAVIDAGLADEVGSVEHLAATIERLLDPGGPRCDVRR